MDQQLVRSIVIVGGGTAGWMTAAALSKISNARVSVTVVESDEIGIVGVGEATIPHIVAFNRMLGIDEDEFLRETQGTFKLGIEFVNWGASATATSTVSAASADRPGSAFHQYLAALHERPGRRPGGVFDQQGGGLGAKFMRPRPDMADSPLADIAYAYHFDAGLYARYLRRWPSARRRAHRRQDRRGAAREASGFIAGVVLASGDRVEGDLFVDCSGFRGLLIEEDVEDRLRGLVALAAVRPRGGGAQRSVQPLMPYTRATAHSAGWQWRIPLQHRIGNGHVYSSRFISEDDATAILIANLDSEPLAEPAPPEVHGGHAHAGMEPQLRRHGSGRRVFRADRVDQHPPDPDGISRLMTLFPTSGSERADIDEVNRQTRIEYEHIRDFVILHYNAQQRDDTPFWRYCRDDEHPREPAAARWCCSRPKGDCSAKSTNCSRKAAGSR